jgi:deoxycytidylate deaminase
MEEHLIPPRSAESDLPSFDSDLYLGFVKAIGSDLSDVKNALKLKLTTAGYTADLFETIKLSSFFPQLLDKAQKTIPEENRVANLSSASEGRFRYYMSRMDAGDWLRTEYGPDILAQRAIAEVGRRRKVFVDRDSKRGRVFIFDSLMHPAEVELMRYVYGRSFFLIAVHSTVNLRSNHIFQEIKSSDPNERAAPPNPDNLPEDEVDRLAREREKANEEQWRRQVYILMQRDEGLTDPESNMTPAPPKCRVAIRRTFSEADVFVAASEPQNVKSVRKPAVIDRFIDLVFGEPFHTPTRAELGMAHAYVAAKRSAHLSRQVGAAICSTDGDLLGVGVNEVPAAGGGHYWPEYDGTENDQRDFLYRFKLADGTEIEGVDSNDVIKVDAFMDLLKRAFGALGPEALFPGSQQSLFMNSLKINPEQTANDLFNNESVRAAQFFDVIEFSRALHAEMSALMACLRNGMSIRGAVLYCTTFPCHECSRHIIAAGISQVIYVEPYAKSRVAQLHADSVTVDQFTGPPAPGEDHIIDRLEGKKVSFEPFIGISPNRHNQLYSLVKRKIDGQVEDRTQLGRRKYWSLGPNTPLRPSVRSIQPVAAVAEVVMVKASEEYVDLALLSLGLIDEELPGETTGSLGEGLSSKEAEGDSDGG